jgi:outer membrane protein
MTRVATRIPGGAAAILSILAVAVWTLSAASAGAQSAKGSSPAARAASGESAPAATAPHAGATRVAFVDIERISTEAKFVRDMLGNMETEIEAKRTAIAHKQETYDKLRDDLVRKREVWSQSEYDANLKQSHSLRTELEDLDYEMNKALDKYKKEVLAPALERILKAVQEVAQRDGFDIVLRGEMIVHGDPSVDLSDRVIEYVNADYKPSAKDSSAKEPAVSKDTKSTKDTKSATKDTKDSKEPKRAPAVSGE